AARTDEAADPETSSGAWSATDPAGLELAPAPGGEAAMETPKKTRARSASKTATTQTKKTGDGTAKKTTTRRAASKESAETTDKPTRTRKKADTTTVSE